MPKESLVHFVFPVKSKNGFSYGSERIRHLIDYGKESMRFVITFEVYAIVEGGIR